MKANYHTHTRYCGHANGTVDEYVKVAIERGLETLGFACHVPYPFNNGYRSGFRIQLEDHEKYVKDVLEAREKYRDQINILLGYEAEYYPKHFDDMIANIKKYPVDYIILGQHESDNEYDGLSNHDPARALWRVENYANTLCTAMRTGLFTYIAHPDLLTYEGDIEEYLGVMSRVCETSLETDTPLELNLLGLSEGRDYPKNSFTGLMGRYGCKVVIGCDAHSADRVAKPWELEQADAFAKKHGLNVVETVELKKL